MAPHVAYSQEYPRIRYRRPASSRDRGRRLRHPWRCGDDRVTLYVQRKRFLQLIRRRLS